MILLDCIIDLSKFYVVVQEFWHQKKHEIESQISYLIFVPCRGLKAQTLTLNNLASNGRTNVRFRGVQHLV